MEVFELININTWPRKFYFDYYFQQVKCTYSFVASIDISNLLAACKQNKIKLYPVMLYIISRAVNGVKELHVDMNEHGQLGQWNFLSPFYTLFQEDEKTFTNIWTVYDADFSIFHRLYLNDLEQYGQIKNFMAKPNDPGNTFPVSCIPWIDFTAFNLNIYDDASYLKPIFTIGKYTMQQGKVMMPLAIQCHHAICDGYHAGLLLNQIKNLAEFFEKWMLL